MKQPTNHIIGNCPNCGEKHEVNLVFGKSKDPYYVCGEDVIYVDMDADSMDHELVAYLHKVSDKAGDYICPDHPTAEPEFMEMSIQGLVVVCSECGGDMRAMEE